MRFISWNVNGLRACMNKGFTDTFRALDADFFCLQETKLQSGQIQMDLPGYHQYWCYAEKKGYSGTAIFTKHKPLSVTYGLGIGELDTEGRVICLEYSEFYLVTCYTPNAQRGLARIEHRLRWEEAFRSYLTELDKKRPVIICGDLNVAHKEIDLKNPSSNRGNAGFSDQEREAFSRLLDAGFTDSFRYLYPDTTGAYSWWSYMFNARANNAGWRIDYFLVSQRLQTQIHDATIHPDVMGSDHCPVGLDLDTTCNGGLSIPTPDLTDTTQEKEADGDSPVGSFRLIRSLSLLACLILLFLVPNLIPTKQAPQPQTTDPTEAVPPTALISQIIDRTGTVRYLADTGNATSSSIGSYFACEDERWRLEDMRLSFEPVRLPNFFLQLQFTPNLMFDSQDAPQIQVTDLTARDQMIDKDHYIFTSYYRENGNISGCFIYGYDTVPITLQITATWEELTQTLGPVTLRPVKIGQLLHSITIHSAAFKIQTGYEASTLGIPVSIQTQDHAWDLLPREDLPQHMIQWRSNFLIELRFPEGAAFTEAHLPTIHPTFKLDTEQEDLQYDLRYFYGDGHRIAGALLYGYVSNATDLFLKLQFNGHSVTEHLYLDPDFGPMTTDDLAYTLCRSNEIKYHIEKDPDNYMDLLQEHSPAFQELLTRNDVIAVMLDVNDGMSFGTNFDVLLFHPHFYDQMTKTQKRRLLDRLITTPIIYG